MARVQTATDRALLASAECVEACLGRWFPSPAFVRAAPIAPYPILVEEQALVANAVTSRQQEFATGRWLAREGLRHFAVSDVPLLMGRLRNPLWPDAMLGTLSHDEGLCAVVLMRKADCDAAGIGIDLIHMPQRSGRMHDLAPMFVANDTELNAIATLDATLDPAMLLFSVKESVVKAMTFELDDFIDLRAIEIFRDDGLKLRVDGAAVDAFIQAAVCDGFVLTAVKVRA